MISPFELRLGNWIEDPYGKYFQVVGLYERTIMFHTSQHHEANEINGVKLTSEILEAAGFVNGIKHPLKVSVFDTTIEVLLIYKDYIQIGRITTVHQLQNLYYSLTGEELTINLNQLQQA